VEEGGLKLKGPALGIMLVLLEETAAHQLVNGLGHKEDAVLSKVFLQLGRQHLEEFCLPSSNGTLEGDPEDTSLPQSTREIGKGGPALGETLNELVVEGNWGGGIHRDTLVLEWK